MSSIAAATSSSDGTPPATVLYKTHVTVMCSAGFRFGSLTERPSHVSTSLPRDTLAALARPLFFAAGSDTNADRNRVAAAENMELARLSFFTAFVEHLKVSEYVSSS